MVEKNFKNATIKAQDYENIIDAKKDLNKFLIYHCFNLKTWGFKKKVKSKNFFLCSSKIVSNEA
jgi:hypothetical protein